MNAAYRTLENEGRLWMRQAVCERDLALLDDACGLESKPGRRLDCCDDLDSVLGRPSGLVGLARSVVPDCNPMRVVAFNKNRLSNWGVPWHQDRVIAVTKRHAVPGFDAWSRKAGTWHCEPPTDLLRRMFFIRVHLDQTNELNGCLELALGTHRCGAIPADDASRIADTAPREICRARRGDLLLVKMLTLHRSLPSRTGRNRRTLRIDYSADRLPRPLRWAYMSE